MLKRSVTMGVCVNESVCRRVFLRVFLWTVTVARLDFADET